MGSSRRGSIGRKMGALQARYLIMSKHRWWIGLQEEMLSASPDAIYLLAETVGPPCAFRASSAGLRELGGASVAAEQNGSPRLLRIQPWVAFAPAESVICTFNGVGVQEMVSRKGLEKAGFNCVNIHVLPFVVAVACLAPWVRPPAWARWQMASFVGYWVSSISLSRITVTT